MNVLVRFWRWLHRTKRPPPLSEEERIFQTHPELRPTPRKGTLPATEVWKARKLIDIQTKNRQRRTKFANSEHFKQRQPTTARKLWKPNATFEEEE